MATWRIRNMRMREPAIFCMCTRLKIESSHLYSPRENLSSYLFYFEELALKLKLIGKQLHFSSQQYNSSSDLSQWTGKRGLSFLSFHVLKSNISLYYSNIVTYHIIPRNEKQMDQFKVTTVPPSPLPKPSSPPAKISFSNA